MAGAIPKQTQEDIVPPPPIAIGYRLGAILLTAPVAATVQLILDGPVELDLMVPEVPGSSTLTDLSILRTTLITLAVSLVAYVSVLILERGLGADRGRSIWMWAATGVFVLSLGAIVPLDVTAGQKWGLVVLHAVVALMLIPSMLAKGTPGEHPPTNLGEPPTAGDIGAPAAEAQDDSAHPAPHDHDHADH